MAKQTDIQLLAGLDIDSSEKEILQAIKIIEKRLKANTDARFKLNADIDETVIKNTIEKLQKILDGKELNIDTKSSIQALTKEVNSFADVAVGAKKASSKKLEFAKANERVRRSADDTTDAINRERQAMGNMEDLDYILENVNMRGQTGNSVFQTLRNTLNDAFQTYTVADLLTDSIHESVDAGKEAVEMVKEWDDAATSLRMATGASKETVDQYMKSYNELGQELGSITQTVSNSADTWLRQGYDINDTNELIRDSIILSTVAQMDSADSSKYLTSSMKGYHVAVSDVIGIVDKLCQVDLNAAVSAEGLAEGMSRVSAVAESAGIGMDRLLGYLAVIGEASGQEMSSVGVALRTILLRMQDIKSGKLELIDENGTTELLSDVETSLKNVGIDLRSTVNEFNSAGDVLDNLAEKWNTFSSVQQAALRKSFAGQRQGNMFQLLMENYDRASEYMDISANSAGASTEKFEAHINSLEAKTNSLKASLEALAQETIPNDLYASVLDTSKAVVDLTTNTGILKGTLSGLGVSANIYLFRQFTNYIGEAVQGFANLNEAMNMTRSGVGINDMQRLIDLTGGLSQSQTHLLLSTNTLTDAQRMAILINQNLANGMNRDVAEATARATLNTYGLSAAQQGVTASTVTLTGVLRGLWSTLVANPLILVTAGVTAATMAWNAYQQKLEETRQATLESANSYKESAKSIDEYVSKYQDLHKALQNARGDEQETYNVKKQLLDLQNQLNDEYGDEYGRLNLVASGYQDLTDSIKAYNKEASQAFLNENYAGIKDAEKQMTKERHYNLSGTGVSQYTEEGSVLRKVAVEYEDQGVSVLDNEDGTFSVHITADAESASATIDSFMDDLREKAQELGKEHLFDDVLQVSSEGLNRAKETIDSYGEIYRQALMAEIVVDDSKANIYNRVLSAVDSYNNAITISADPYNDQNVEKARQELESVRLEIQNNEAEWSKYSLLLNDVFNQADTHLLDFNAKLQNDTGLQKLTADLQGLQDVDLQSLNPGENNSFDKLKESADEAGVSVDELIRLLVQAGTVQGEITSQTENTPGVTFDISKFEELNEQIDSIQSAYKGLMSAAEEYNQHGYVTADTLQTLLALDGEYLACLVNENGQLQLNGTAYQNLVQAKLADAKTTAVQQAIQELSKVTTEQQIQADVTSIGIMAEKQSALIGLSEKYSALAGCAISAAEAQALADGYLEASNTNQEEADRIMSNLNAKLALIDSTATSTAGSFGALTNHLNGFTDATGNATDATDEFTKSLQKQKDALEDEKDALTDKKEYYEKVADAVNWYLGEQIEQQNKIIEGIEKENTLLEERLSSYDDALSAVDRFYVKEQEALRAQIDAMSEANTEKEKSLALEKAQYALQQAQNNRTKLVYSHNKGFSFQADQNAISEAQDNLANATEDMTKYQIEQEIQKIQELRDAWAEIPQIKQKAEQDSIVSQLLGANWEAQLMNGRLDAITAFKESYLGIQTEIDNNESLIASYEEKVQYYEQLQEQWQSMLDRYTEYENTQLLIMEFGNNYAEELLKGRTEKWDNFANNYFDVQMRLKDVTDQIASITKQMEEYAARMESAANRAVVAAQKAASAGSGSGSFSTNSNSTHINGRGTFGGSAFAKGGIISKKDASDLDYIAESLGEDHMVATQEGEAVIPKSSVEANPELVKHLISSDDTIILKNGDKLNDVTPLINDDSNLILKRSSPIDIAEFAMKFQDFPIQWNISKYNIPQETIMNNKVSETKSTNLHFHDGLVFPNITNGNDAQKLVNELLNLSNNARQHAAKR